MRYRQTLLMLMLLLVSGLGFAQNNTNSPYTRYGYGQLAEQGASNSLAMGGVAYGIRDKAHTNFVNPASYTAVDSLTFIFEGGLSLQNTNFDNNSNKVNAKNTRLDYLTMHFRVGKDFGMSFGLLPFANVGYDMENTVEDEDQEKTYSTNYFGEGGFHQAYVGLAYKINRKFSIGANISYLWGDIKHAMMVTFPYNTSAYGITREEDLKVNSVKIDIGAQYSYQFGKKHFATFGAVFSPKLNLHNDAYQQDALGLTNALLSGDASGLTVTTTDIKGKSGIPMTIGVGGAYIYDGRLTVGLDATYQQWSKVPFMGQDGLFADMTKVSLGAEYLPDPVGRRFYMRTKYRMGLYYSRPYYKIDGKRATTEWGVSAGFSIPIIRSRSYFNLSAQYVRVNGQNSGLINENQLRINIGVTFNERWFYKTRVN